jgi:hypothetical protein
MARPRKRTTHAGARARVDAVRHKDKRKNIPTEELRDFVREEEQQPRKVLYLRDPDLDPQLVWKGKDEQDAHPLEVPAVPIYIQEKIHPQAIIEDFKASAARAKGAATTQPDLFSDFNGLPADFADRVDFYHHEGNWSNRLILGDSLLVMTSLAEKEALKGQVQMIYLDPPYGIKFGSNWQVSTRKRDVRDGKPEDVVRQPEQVKAFRDTWQLGIHSYLSYLRDRLIVCGFAFDPHVSEEAKRYGKLVVLPCRMNPDLAMGELLKKTGSGNLFMVFGEPDVAVKKAAGGKLTVEIKGLDVYDPTTGEIRSSSTDDIACWFIDTNYNGESFFVRHAYFTGADQPYDKLKRALRAEVDEAAWSALYSTTSRPFEKPPTGKIAIKVINHYGDEVLKVYEVK